MKNTIQIRNLLKYVVNPITILICPVLGILFGIFFKQQAQMLKPIGEIYIALLKMCVIPIMSSAIFIHVANLMKAKKSSRLILKMFAIFIVSSIIISLISLSVAFIAKPLIFSDYTISQSIGNVLVNDNDSNATTLVREIDSNAHESKHESENQIIGFIKKLIPQNIFTALNNEDTLKIIFFFLLAGIMTKFISDEASENIIIIFEGVYEAFHKIIAFLMYLLPIGAFSLISTQFSYMDQSLYISLLKFILLIYCAAIIIFLLCTLILWKNSNKSYLSQFKNLVNVIVVSLCTQNSYAAIPYAITGLQQQLPAPKKDIVNLSISLGIPLCRYGYIVLFSVTAVFAGGLYSYNFTFAKILILIITSILAALATSGSSSLTAVAFISLVLTPLAIPDSAMCAILIAILPIIDSIITLINVYPTCTCAAIMNSDKKVLTAVGLTK